jgi:hypothetical protein
MLKNITVSNIAREPFLLSKIIRKNVEVYKEKGCIKMKDKRREIRNLKNNSSEGNKKSFMNKKYGSFIVASLLVFAMTGCSVADIGADTGESTMVVLEQEVTNEESATKNTVTFNETEATNSSESVSTQETSDNDLFTDRDMEQTYDVEDATYYELESNQEIVFDHEGVYVFS